MKAGVFGVWDAPVTDELDPIPTPVGERCMHCREQIAEGDNGAVMPFGHFVQHRECSLRSVMGGIGHHIDHARYCAGEFGTDAGLSYRRSALLVWQLLIERKRITEANLEHLRERTV